MKKNNSCCCLVFTRNPELGKTKTRLIPALGIDGAYDVHVQLLNFTLNLTSKIQNIDFTLFYTSEKKSEWLLSLADKNNLSHHIQVDGTLGDRMFHALNLNLQHYSTCIIIGTDCPELTTQYLLDAQHYLSTDYDAVIGPAFDGGYVLIGLNTAYKAIFENIDWGENSVLQSTLKIFDKLKLKYKKLSILHDVDTKEDLKYLKSIKNN